MRAKGGQPTLARTRVRTHLRAHLRARRRALREQSRNRSRTAAAPREVYEVQHDKSGNPECNTGPREPVRAFDYASVVKVLRDEKSFQNYGRSVLILAHETSLRLALTAIAAGRRTGERRGARGSTPPGVGGGARGGG